MNNTSSASPRHESATQVRGYNAMSTVEKIEAIRETGRIAVLVQDDDAPTLDMARALGCVAPGAGVVFAVAGAVALFAAEMVETACCLGNGKHGYVTLYAGKADVA